MESLQEIALRKLLFQDSYNEILKRFLLHTVDFNKLTEDTLFLIYMTFDNESRIIDKIPDLALLHFNNECSHCDVLHSLLPNGCPYISDEEESDSDSEEENNWEI
jgi:hypothetical protein